MDAFQPPRSERAGVSGATLVVLALLAIVPYLNALPNAFVYDDLPQVLGNPYVHSFRYAAKIFGRTVWSFQGSQGATNYYRPLLTLQYMVCYQLFGPVPFGFREVNVALYAAVVLLLFALTERLFGDRRMSLVAAGLFALHPVHTEAVAWIAGVSEVQLAAFALLTFLFYLRLGRADSPRRAWPTQAAVVASYVLALLSKEQALVLPLLLVAYEHFYRSDRAATSFRMKAGRYAPVCIAAAAYLAFRVFVLGGFAPVLTRPGLTRREVLWNAAALAGAYLWKLVWPTHLSAFYVFRESHHWNDPRVLGGFAALAICLALFVWLWRRHRTISFAVLWMGITLAPVLNVRWMALSAFADRYLFLPSIGFCWLAGWAVAAAWRASASAPAPAPAPARALLARAFPATLAIVAILCGVRTVRRNQDWRTEETLYRQIVEEQPDAAIIRTSLGEVLWQRGDTAGAEREWLASLGPPSYATTLDDLGMLRTRQKRYAEAISFLQSAIAGSPSFLEPHMHLAEAYLEMGRDADAEAQFRRAVALSPLSVEAHNAFAQFLLDLGRSAEAREQFTASIQGDDNAEAEQALGGILAKAGDAARARSAYQSAIALDAYDAGANFGLAALDERDGRHAQAIREYRAGLVADPLNADANAALRRLAATSASP